MKVLAFVLCLPVLSHAQPSAPVVAAQHVPLRFKAPVSVDDAKKVGDYRANLSAAAFTGGGKELWLADDEAVAETPSIERLTRQADGSYGDHRSFAIDQFVKLPDPGKKEGRVGETDTEGLAVDGGYLWFTGSHSLNRKKPDKKDEGKNLERLAEVDAGPNRFILGRIPLADDGSGRMELKAASAGLTAAQLRGDSEDGSLVKALRGDKHLGRFIPPADPSADGIPSKDNGLDIEGIAVSGQRIFLGLRGPVLRGWAVIIEIALKESPGHPGELRLAPINQNGALYVKHFISLGGLGVRDLCVDGKDLLVLAGPTMSLDGPAAVFRWKDALAASPTDSLVPLDKVASSRRLDLPCGALVGGQAAADADQEGFNHPEGIALIPGSDPAKKRVLVVYDSPGDLPTNGTDTSADVFDLP